MPPGPPVAPPVPPDRITASLIHAAWIGPAVIVSGATLVAAVRQPVGISAPEVLRALLCVAWIGTASLPGWRGTLNEIGQLVLARVGVVALLLVLTVLLLVTTSRGLASPWGAAAGGVCFLALAAVRTAWARRRRELLFSLVLLAGVILLLMPLDWAVGAFVLPRRSHNNLFIEHDSLLGWKLRRGLRARRESESYASTETINALGFRTARLPAPKPDSVTRILFLGDSHTESYTVNDTEMYPVLLEATLNRSRAVETIAIGVGGFSTDQELLAYLRYGRLYRPDLVVLQFCSNDVPFNVLDHYWRGYKPRFVRYGDLLLLSGVPVPNYRNTGLFGGGVLQRSSIVLLLETVLRQLAIQRSVQEEADPEEAWQTTALLLRDLNQVVRSDGARLVVFQADRQPEVEQRLRGILDRYSIPYIATDGAYTEDFDSYWVDGHWNQKGHRAIAAVLDSALRPYLP